MPHDGYPGVGDVWRNKASGMEVNVVGKGGDRPWPITWASVTFSPDGTFFGLDYGTKRTMRDWFESFEFVREDGVARHEVSWLSMVEGWEREGDDCSEFRREHDLPQLELLGLEVGQLLAPTLDKKAVFRVADLVREEGRLPVVMLERWLGGDTWSSHADPRMVLELLDWVVVEDVE